ncbi:MAG TPA: DotI/IcmL/TraM family protein [Gammaproteobacteria bacterium]|nr:DotI/IcmL/TraM family protein [Gammaproteobacteria bacterium]
MNTEDKNDALVMVHLRNEFYRRKYRFVMGIYVLSLIANAILVGMVIYLLRHPTEPLYFAADKIGRLIKTVPLQTTDMTLQDVSNWSVEAVEAAYSYDFVNYRRQLQDAQKYFTGYGWRNYMKALAASNNFKALTQRKFIVIAKVVEPPKLIVQGLLAGSLAWKFQMPVLVTYLMPPFNDTSKFVNPLIVTVTVQRQPILQSYKGLGVLQLIANIATK